MLAQLQTVDPSHLKDLLMIVLAIAGPIMAALGMYYGRRKSVAISGQPIQVQGSPTFVTRDMAEQMAQATGREVADLKARVTSLEGGQRDLLDKIDQRLDAMRAEIKEDRTNSQRTLMDEITKVHNRVNAVLAAVAEVRGAMHLPNTSPSP